ncbi:uncharacterized protein [Phaseolus vulgaris]|uniref:uncharacterized protein n=1 Tax=Phaseolus vulgaris TaxID=3885 RepID=UPI0035C9D32A
MVEKARNEYLMQVQETIKMEILMGQTVGPLDCKVVELQAENSSLRERSQMVEELQAENASLRQQDSQRVEMLKAAKEATAAAERKLEEAVAKVENLEKRSVDREVLLGKVEKERDDTVAELAEAREGNAKSAAELAQAREENKKVAEDLAQTRRETEELKKRADELKQQTEGLKQQNEDLELSSAQVLAAGFDAAL